MLPAVDFFSVPKVVPTLSGSKAIFILDNPTLAALPLLLTELKVRGGF